MSMRNDLLTFIHPHFWLVERCGKMIWALLPLFFVIGVIRFWFGRRPVCPNGERKARIETVLENQDKIKYDVKCFDLPKLMGWKFKILVWLSYTRFGRYIIEPIMLKNSNLNRMGVVNIPELPTYFPVPPTFTSAEDHTHSNQEVVQALVDKEVGSEGSQDGFHLPTVADFVSAYRSGKTTPTRVADTILAAITHSDRATPPLRAIVQTSKSVVLAMAEASTQRWKEGKTLSILDGVPIAIKEELRCEPYELFAGACYLPQISRGVPEAVLVRKLKDAGAVIIGIANMHEYGTGTLGSNPHPPHLTSRNPYDPQCYPGGSSSGSAVSVAAGFCPISIGADGGGSIRIPATLCGTVGLKPTFGLVDSLGILPKAFTVGACGPLTSSVLDTAITMSVIAQAREGDKTPLSLEGLGEQRLDGLRVGVYWDHFNDADKEVVLKCKAALGHLKKLGAEVIDIRIPEMEDTRIAHVVSIGAEFVSSLGMDLDEHFSELNLETHLLVGTSCAFSAMEYVNAQRQRTRAMEALKFIFKKVDVIATPGSAIPAPAIEPEAVSFGVLDGTNSGKLMRFSFLANLTGIPGLVLPVGYTETSGLPIGLQLMAGWHQESLLLKVGWALEQTGAFPAKKPKVFYDVIASSN